MPKPKTKPTAIQVSEAKLVLAPLIHRNTISEGFTQSEISDMSCMQRWNNRYNQRLQKPGIIRFPFVVGSAWHGGMEQFYATKGARVHIATLQPAEGDIPSLADLEEFKYWNAVLPMMMEAYAIYYKQDHIKWKIHSIEREMDVTYRGLRLRGKIDLTINDGSGDWIVDHKTTSRLMKDIIAGWDFRFQFMFYIWMLSKVDPMKIKGYYVNAVKKPELRVKKTESLEEFAVRVRQDMIIEPDKYFYREPYLISKGNLDHFEQVVVNPKITRLLFVIDNPDHPLSRAIIEDKNTDECQKYGGAPCEFIDLCRYGNMMKALFREKERKHLELEDVA